MQKKTYQRPIFLRHGSVEQVTLQMLGLHGDGGSMLLMMMKMQQGGS